MESKYGECLRCGSELIPIWCSKEEFEVNDGRLTYTGKTRRVCSHLECPSCLKKHCVDDTFDDEWY